MKKLCEKEVFLFITTLAFFILIFFSWQYLTEVPPTWMDEGIITQVALNVVQHGVYGIQIAPREFVPAGFITTSYPVIYPLVIAFSIGGVSLTSARVVMALFLMFIGVMSFFLIRSSGRSRNNILSALALLLLVTFAPLYGNGKNVLGEVPGLVFLLLSVLLLRYGERSCHMSNLLVLGSGLFLGVSMATKPVYLILIFPSMLVTLYFYRSLFTKKQLLFFFSGALIPLGAWLLIHFSGDSFFELMGAGNPDKISSLVLLRNNLTRFFSEAQPFYALILIGTWTTSLALRKKNSDPISISECLLFCVALFGILSYGVTRGFYRYLFPSELLSLIFLPHALSVCISFFLRNFRFRSSCIAIPILCILIGLQSYQLFFSSWVADAQGSNRSALLSKELSFLPLGKTIFLYHVPEAVIFLPHDNYYQYVKFADSVQRGTSFLPLVEQGTPDFLLVDQKFPSHISLSSHYVIRSQFDKYTLYEKK